MMEVSSASSLLGSSIVIFEKGRAMAQHLELVTDDHTAAPVWSILRQEAQQIARTEPSLASLMNAVVLRHANLGERLAASGNGHEILRKPDGRQLGRFQL